MKSPAPTQPATATHASADSFDTFAYSQAQLAALAEQAIQYAQSKGASATELSISESSGQSVSVRCGEVENIEYNCDKGLAVTVYLGQKKGHADTSDFSVAAIQQAIDSALAIASYTSADPCAGLADPQLFAREFPDLSLYHPWDISVQQQIELAKTVEEAAFLVDKRITNSEGASVSTYRNHFVSANSAGFCAGFPSTSHSISCAVIAESDDTMERDYWYHSHRLATQLQSATSIGRTAGERTVRRLAARQPPTGEYPVIFEAPLAAGLIGNLVHAVSGGALYRRATFLEQSLGTQIFPDFVTLEERPFLKMAMGSTPFDGDCVATRDRDVVAGGILQGYFLSVYSGRKLNMPTTGNAGGSHNLRLCSSQPPRTLDEMLKEMGTGILLTELLGQGVNYVTGDYSRGAAGFWVENGEIAYPIHEFTIAGHLRQMFKDIVAIGNDVHIRGSKQTGSICIERMKIAGN